MQIDRKGKHTYHILIIEPDQQWQAVYKQIFDGKFNVKFAKDFQNARRRFSFKPFNVIISETSIPGKFQFGKLCEFTRESTDTIFIVITKLRNQRTVMEFQPQYLFEYFFKSDALGEMLPEFINQELRKRELKLIGNENKYRLRTNKWVGSKSFLDLINNYRYVFGSNNTNILITGETGTGKTELARYLHAHSDKFQLPFVHINCPSIPSTLLESELFGYVKGAFTGATRNTRGKFQAAGKGIIFLDEIADLPESLQSKLLKVIDDGSFYPIGSTTLKKSEARIISATNKNLDRAIQEGSFRQDLYFRLAGYKIELLPLRERKADIIPLVKFYLKKGCEIYKIDEPELDSDVIDYFMTYTWPGNVRELDNLIQKLLIFKPTKISMDLINRELKKKNELLIRSMDGHFTVKQMSRIYAYETFLKTGKNLLQTSKILGLDRKTLRGWLIEFEQWPE